MLNGLPMLARADHAMPAANAHPDVLVAADEITASNGNDGSTLALERLFPDPAGRRTASRKVSSPRGISQ